MLRTQIVSLQKTWNKKLYGHYNDIFMVPIYSNCPEKNNQHSHNFSFCIPRKKESMIAEVIFGWTILLKVWWNFWSMFYKLKKFDQAQCQTGESKSYNQITFTFRFFREPWLWSYSSYFNFPQHISLVVRAIYYVGNLLSPCSCCSSQRICFPNTRPWYTIQRCTLF